MLKGLLLCVEKCLKQKIHTSKFEDLIGLIELFMNRAASTLESRELL